MLYSTFGFSSESCQWRCCYWSVSVCPPNKLSLKQGCLLVFNQVIAEVVFAGVFDEAHALIKRRFESVSLALTGTQAT